MDVNEITEVVIGACIAMHKALGPGVLEPACEACVCHEPGLRHGRYRRQKRLPSLYKGVELDCNYRIDLLVEDLVIVELKSLDKLMPIHDARLLTYLKLADRSVGLPVNFNVPVLKNGIRRKELKHVD